MNEKKQLNEMMNVQISKELHAILSFIKGGTGIQINELVENAIRKSYPVDRVVKSLTVAELNKALDEIKKDWRLRCNK